MPAVALVIALLLARPRGTHANFFGSIENWFDSIFGGDATTSVGVRTPRLLIMHCFLIFLLQ